MTPTSRQRSDEFLKIADQFKLGVLVTESSHPVTANLSEVANQDTAGALGLLFDVDKDVVRKYREWAESGAAERIAGELLKRLRAGGRVFFTGCGSTGRLSVQLVSIWRDFWQPNRDLPDSEEWENRAFSVMAGGDFALIKAVEGFEDYTDFGKKQIGDLGISSGDVVFAITEGGETSFVIGTAWKGVEVGAKVYFVYNNPDDVLREHVQRSREVIDDPRIEKINLTTGPMAITGSTRMQATTIQLCVMLTVLEMVVQGILNRENAKGRKRERILREFADRLEEIHATLGSEVVRKQLARLVEMEESVYRSGHRNNYYAGNLGIDVLTDTTERSPTFCIPPFCKFDDTAASESWAYLFVPFEHTQDAWRHILKREPRTVNWTREEVSALVEQDKLERVYATVANIGTSELMKFKIGLDGLKYRQIGPGDSAVGILTEPEIDSLTDPNGFHRAQLDRDRSAGARCGLIYFGSEESIGKVERFVAKWDPHCICVLVPVPEAGLLLDGVTRVAAKMLLNALSTCTMVRLGRVMGNFMIYVVPSNLKLIDRSTRYISKLTGLPYDESNRLLFEVIEYVEPRMKSDQAYPPVVGLAVTRHKYGIGNEEAEEKLGPLQCKTDAHKA